MVVNRILEWYRTGINPQDRLLFLATYLGHRDINSTLVYITSPRTCCITQTSAGSAWWAYPAPSLGREVVS